MVRYLLRFGINVDYIPKNESTEGIIQRVFNNAVNTRVSQVLTECEFMSNLDMLHYQLKTIKLLYAPIFKLLLQHGARADDVSPTCIVMKLYWLINLALRYSQQKHLEDLKSTLLVEAINADDIKIIEKLVKLKADINKPNEHGTTSIGLAWKLRNKSALKILSYCKPKVEIKRKYYQIITITNISFVKKINVLKKLFTETDLNSSHDEFRNYLKNLVIEDLIKSLVNDNSASMLYDLHHTLLNIFIDTIHAYYHANLKSHKFTIFRMKLFIKYGYIDYHNHNMNANILIKMFKINHPILERKLLKLLLYSGIKDKFIGFEGDVGISEKPLSGLTSAISNSKYRSVDLMLCYNNCISEQNLLDDALYYLVKNFLDITIAEPLLKRGANLNALGKNVILNSVSE